MLNWLRPYATQAMLTLLLGWIIGLLCLFLYQRTIAPDVLGGDAGELQFVPYILSLPHPTGYPLNTLIGKLWTLIVPIGTVAYRMNMLSALFAAITVGLVYASIVHINGSRFAAALAALLLGLSDIFWGQAIRADKYPLNALLLALVLFTLVRWSKMPSSRNLELCALAYGLSLTHHRSMLLFFPLLIGYWLWLNPTLLRRRGELARLAMLILLPCLLYLWLPVGASRTFPGMVRPGSLQEWAAYFLDLGYVGAVRPYAGLDMKLATYGRSLLDQFTFIGCLLGLAGLVRQLHVRRKLANFFLLSFVLQAVFSASYEIDPRRIFVFFIPSFVLFTFWIGEGLAWILASSAAVIKRWRLPGYALSGIVLVGSMALLVLPSYRNYQEYREMHLDGGALDIARQELQNGYQARRFAASSLALVEPHSIIVADWEQATPLWYMQQVENVRPDVTVMGVFNSWTEAVATGRPTYLARTSYGSAEPYRFTTTGPLVKVAREPNLQLPMNNTPIQANWEDQIELVGYHYYPSDFKTGYVVPVTLTFRARSAMSQNYALAIYLFAENGVQFWKDDRQFFALGTYSTQRWIPGEIVSDYLEVPFPRIMPVGRYRLGLIVYDSTTLRELTPSGSETKMIYLPYFDVPHRQ